MSIEIQQHGDGSMRLVDDQSANTVAYLDGTTRAVAKKIGQIKRTTTSDTDLFTLPANAVPTALRYYAATSSDAGTTATINVGLGSTSAYFLSGADVKTSSTGQGQVTPNGALELFTGIGSGALPVTGKYAETGTASTTGGPWNVEIEYYVP